MQNQVEMRGPSCLKLETKEGIKLDKLSSISKLEKEPPLSGAYIRSLVKQLTTTSKTKDSIMNPKDPDCVVVVDSDISQGAKLAKHAQQPTRPQQHKKQVRRRLHISRPYQERLLNMAEARREIVTALKFHRAAMKQANEQQHQRQQAQEQQQQPQASSVSSLQPSQHPSFEQDGRFKSRRNPRIHLSRTTNFSSYMNDFSYSSFSHPPPPPPPPPLPPPPLPPASVPNSYTWPVASPVAPPLVAENPNFMLPNQTLGLSLNFHDFNNLDATLYLNNNNNSSLYSYSSPTSSSPPLSVVTDQEVPSIGISQGEGVSSLVDTIESSGTTLQVTGGLHTAMDDKGMAEIRSLGEQYQMEWNDTMNLVTSARWFKFLNNMEHGAPEVVKTEDDAYHIFDEQMEFPAWLNANESCLEQCSEDYFQDPTLSCMDIGDIEGMDEEWLA